MKTKSIYQGIALLAVALTTAACQNELNEESSQPQPGEKINMTIRATQGMATQTRTSYEDKLGGTPFDGIVVKWEGGTADGAPVEKIKVFGYDVNELTYSVNFNSNPSDLSDDGKSITFEGTINKKEHYLAMYPADNCIYDETDGVVYTSFLGQTQDCTSPMKHLKDYDLMVGNPEAKGKYDKFTFTHEATMIRFILSLPSTEIITKVSLSSTVSLYSRMYTSNDGYNGAVVVVDNDPEYVNPIPSFDLNITGHSASATPLNAYMMMPPIDLSNAILTITVSTDGGSTYTGTLTTEASTTLKAGFCYTLAPTLALSTTVTVPPVTAGGLKDELDKITSLDPTQTELALTGTVSSNDITALAAFLQATKAEKITKLDLSGLTYPNGADGTPEVSGLANCTKVVEVILPNNAEAIGDNAFADCTALTDIIQNDIAPSAPTRASMPKKVKTVGISAFKGCTSMTEMFLHSGITSVGDNAFEGCAALKALVFEGTKTVGAGGITLDNDILKDCTHGDLKIFLPAITNVDVAATYKATLGKPTFFDYAGYTNAYKPENLNSENYKPVLDKSSSLGDFESGGNWGK